MFLEDAQYEHALDLLVGRKAPSDLLLDLREWALERWNIHVLDVFYDVARSGLRRLYVVLSDPREEFRAFTMNANEKKVHRSFDKIFRELAERYPNETTYRTGDSFFVAFNSFAGEICPKILGRARAALRALAKEPEFQSKGLWEVHESFESVHFFYQTDAQIEENERRGVSGRLRERCNAIVKPYDEFGFFPGGVPCFFSSKQTIDEKYDGKMFYYFR